MSFLIFLLALIIIYKKPIGCYVLILFFILFILGYWFIKDQYEMWEFYNEPYIDFYDSLIGKIQIIGTGYIIVFSLALIIYLYYLLNNKDNPKPSVMDHLVAIGCLPYVFFIITLILSFIFPWWVAIGFMALIIAGFIVLLIIGFIYRSKRKKQPQYSDDNKKE